MALSFLHLHVFPVIPRRDPELFPPQPLVQQGLHSVGHERGRGEYCLAAQTQFTRTGSGFKLMTKRTRGNCLLTHRNDGKEQLHSVIAATASAHMATCFDYMINDGDFTSLHLVYQQSSVSPRKYSQNIFKQ